MYQAFIADASKPAVRWVIPSEGKLRIDLDYQRLHHQVLQSFACKVAGGELLEVT